MIIPQLLQELSYHSFYETNKFPFTILDNGAFEQEKLTHHTTEDLYTLARVLNATHLVMPDDINCNDKDPLSTFKQQIVDLPDNLIPVYVVHSIDAKRYAYRALEALHYQRTSARPITIALPSICLRRFNTTSVFYPEYLRYHALITLCGLWQAKFGAEKIPHLHLFGAISLKEIALCIKVLTSVTDVVTFDSSDPVRIASSWTTKDPFSLPISWELLRDRINKEVTRYDEVAQRLNLNTFTG